MIMNGRRHKRPLVSLVTIMSLPVFYPLSTSTKISGRVIVRNRTDCTICSGYILHFTVPYWFVKNLLLISFICNFVPQKNIFYSPAPNFHKIENEKTQPLLIK